MKSLIRLTFAAAVSVALFFTTSNVSAQQAIAGWCVDAITSAQNGGGPPPAPFTNSTANVNVTVYPMTKGTNSPGIGVDSGLSEAYGGVDFTNLGVADSEANSIADGYYITYAIQAAYGYTISFNTNLVFFHNSATGPWEAELQYSTNGASYSDVASMNYTNGNIAWTGYQAVNLEGVAALQNVPSTTTNFFRIVNWGATGTGGTWYIDGPNKSSATNAFPGTLAIGTTNEFTIFGSVNSLFGPVAPSGPTNIVVLPTNQTVNAGQAASFSITAAGSPPTYTWH